jgi:hypothetical protein
MRTTLNIDSLVLEDLKRLQAATKISLGQLASELLAEAIARREAGGIEPPSFSWQSQAMRARIDLQDKDALYAALERDER